MVAATTLPLLASLVLATAQASPLLHTRSTCPDVDAGFDVEKVINRATELSSHSWEYGTAAEALLELKNPEFSVFSKDAFPNGKLPAPDASIASLAYAQGKISTSGDTLVGADGAAGDPASLGVSAILLGQSDASYGDAAERQKNHLLDDVPRMPNGAISHREDSAEAWADFVYMAPPFLAYAAVRDNDAGLLKESVRQAGLYREILQQDSYWKHIVPGPDGSTSDKGIWSTGNGWAAMGMARVLATAQHWSGSDMSAECETLVGYIKEIIDGARGVDRDADNNNLLRNYLPDGSWFGEVSGTAALAAATYRMAVLAPDVFGDEYVQWADENRAAVAVSVGDDGTLAPAVNPLGWSDRSPDYDGSPEGQSFGALMYAAYRDCVCEGRCT